MTTQSTKPAFNRASAQVRTPAVPAARSTSPANTASAVKEVNPETATTHYIKTSNKEFVDGSSIWENTGAFGTYLKIRVTEALAPGDYYISAKRGHVSKLGA